MIRALIVDDKEENLYYLQALLAGKGYEVQLARNGVEALEKARLDTPDVVVSDLLMPVMDGFTLLKNWKADEQLNRAAFIVYTATYTNPEDERLIRGLGADAFLVKPLDPDDFLAEFRAVLAKSTAGGVHLRDEGLQDETTVLKLYNESIIRKLEDKMLELDQANRLLRHDIVKRLKAEAELLQAHQELELRVEERTAELARANQLAQQARAAADGANAAKSEFLTRMSHELRTPLNAILGFGQILEHRALDERSKEGVGHILKAGRHLLELINEILDISRIEAGRVDLALEPVSVHAVVMEALDLVRPLAPQFEVQLLSVPAAMEPAFALADRQRLKQIVINLLSNAIKYNRKGGSVSVTCQPTDEETLLLRVTDTGPGLTEEEMAKLFVPFERLRAIDSKIEGTGLGLALSQRLAAAMNGSLRVESVMGEGSAFCVELPLAASPEETTANIDAHEAPRVNTKSLRTYRTSVILSIEDNLSNARLLEAILDHRPGIRLMSAALGLEGIDLARKHQPDVILLDLHLPDIEGGEVMQRLKEYPETAQIPVVIVSADATPAQSERLITAGALAYLTKPLDVHRFLSVVDNILDGPADTTL